MPDKRQLHHFYTKLRPVKIRYLVVAFVASAMVCAYSLRQNNLTAVRLREKVLQVDKTNGDIESALRELRRHIYAHMNTNLSGGSNTIKPPVQLKYRYERLAAAEKERVSKTNERIYGEAQAYCEQLFPRGLSGSGRIPCIKDYVADRGTTEQAIEDSLYKFDFVSPRWSFDVAGVSLILTILLGVILIVRLAVEYWLKIQLHNHL